MSYRDEELVDFLLAETGDTLNIVVSYDRDEWRFLFVRDVVRERIENWKTQADEIVQEFRQDARRNSSWEQLFEVGSFYCTLRLFDELLLLHFSQPDEQGVIFGYDPAAASNLTAFVERCLPQIRDHALRDINASPAWDD